jgi:hypothetical protein
MDYESERSRTLGCWDAIYQCNSFIDQYSDQRGPLGDQIIAHCGEIVLGGNFDDGQISFLLQCTNLNYLDNGGWQRVRMSTINLRDRDGLHGRLFAIRCPVLWLQVSPIESLYCFPLFAQRTY